jgi:hypothetical protein
MKKNLNDNPISVLLHSAIKNNNHTNSIRGTASNSTICYVLSADSEQAQTLNLGGL